MTIFVDEDFKCHVHNDGTKRGFDVQFFDGKCAEFIEGYRYVPDGERWVKPNGVFFRGEMITPWRDYNFLEAAQNGYDEADAKATAELADLIEQIYEEDLEMFDA